MDITTLSREDSTARIATPHLDVKREMRNPGSIKASFQLGLCSETDNGVEMVGGGTVKQPMETWEKEKTNNELPFEHAHRRGQDDKTKADQISNLIIPTDNNTPIPLYPPFHPNRPLNWIHIRIHLIRAQPHIKHILRAQMMMTMMVLVLVLML